MANQIEVKGEFCKKVKMSEKRKVLSNDPVRAMYAPREKEDPISSEGRKNRKSEIMANKAAKESCQFIWKAKLIFERVNLDFPKINTKKLSKTTEKII